MLLNRSYLFLFILTAFLTIILSDFALCQPVNSPEQQLVSTFSIVARDSVTGEMGIAVASKFFGVGAVVPWAKANVGAIATQSYANTSFGWRGLELLEKGLNPEEVAKILIRNDDNPERRQFGIVAADGSSFTYTGKECLAWAGGRKGLNYAVQGNILASEEVVIALEKTFLETEGTLADRLYAALVAGDAKGGDSRGRQSAAMLIVKNGAGYGGYDDRAIDIRVDDHPEPFQELGRLLKIAQPNYAWNMGWNLFMQKKYPEALKYQELAAKLSPEEGGIFYDLAIIQLALGEVDKALESLTKSFTFEPQLKESAKSDPDLTGLKGNTQFEELIK